MNRSSQETARIIATRLTAPGRGAVASVRLSCAEADDATAIDRFFTAANGMEASSAAVNRVLFGSWCGEDVVVVRTSETEWELHCHGGEAAVTRILSEFEQSDSVDDRSGMDQLLLQTRTTRTARLALAQSSGVLRDALCSIAEVESAELFRERLLELLSRATLAHHLTEPWRVVIAGPPNVGKSSLMNAIAGYDRAIVYDQPGTTRDAVHTELVLDGWPFCFVDTAGIREDTVDPVESVGIAHARSLLETADLILVAMDSTVGWTADHDDIVSRCPRETPLAFVCCKCDLRDAGDMSSSGQPVFRTSAEQGTGLNQLADWITGRLIPEPPDLTTALPVAGSAELCAELLRQLETGVALPDLQQHLISWLQSQDGSWSKS